jgi:hypothetical protein
MKGQSILPLDTSVQAEYQDGFILDETKNNDVSAYDGTHNTFYDILNKLPEPEHGKMVRFSVFWKGHRYDIDFAALSDNAQPIRFRHGNRSTNLETNEQEFWWSNIDFGYQYTKNGQTFQEVQEL